MKRNVIVTFQVGYESELSDDQLKTNIISAVNKTMASVLDADPVGLFLVTVEPGPKFNFPSVPPDEKFASDVHMDRKREFEKELKNEEMWREQK